MDGLVGHGFGCILECREHSFAREPRVRLEELIDRFPTGELSENRLDRNASTPDNRLSGHHVGIGLD